jgi:hypothetical protein
MSNKLKEPTRVIIPVNVAINRTKNWRNFVTDVLQIKEPRKLPKAVYISRTDIKELAAQCEADPTIAGVRTYFTLENGQEERIKNEIKFVMVLVRVSETLPFGEDVLYLPGSARNGDSIDDSNVYDFTRPCPDCCDPTSELGG